MKILLQPIEDRGSTVLLTNIGAGPGPASGVQVQAYDGGHAGDVLPSSPAVLVKDVDLLRFKGQRGLDSHHAARPDDDCGSQRTHSELHQSVAIDVHHAVKTLAEVVQTWGGASCCQPLGNQQEVLGRAWGRTMFL